jgi:hypothetical protein
MASDWALLTGGHYLEVVVRTGLTVLTLDKGTNLIFIWLAKDIFL